MAGAGDGSKDTLAMLRNMSMKAGKAVTDASQQCAAAVSEGTRNLQQSKAGAQAGAVMSNLGTRAAEGGTWLYSSTRSTTQGLMERFVGGSVAAACALEAKDKPCPRMVLVCCNAICAGGLASEGLFQAPTDDEDVAALLTTLTTSHCSALLPPSATPQLIASALKRWLQELRPEPLFTFKLVPALTSASTPNASLGAVLDELPAANRAAVMLLLETVHRIASNAAINDTDAGALAATLSPALLWREGPVPDKATLATMSPEAQAEARKPQPEALPVEDEAVFVKLLTFMIQHYRTFA